MTSSEPITFHQDRASKADLVRSVQSITVHWARDSLRRRSANGAARAYIPTDPRELTPTWLTSVLGTAVDGAKVVDREIPHHDAGTATRVALRLQWNAAGAEAGLPNAIFAKTTNSWQQRLALGLTGAAKGEALFYSRFRPQLEIEAPQGYYGAYDDTSWRSIALMDDVSETRGARFLNPLETSDRQSIEDLLGDLAQLHGRFWAHPELASCGLRDSFNLISTADSVVNFRGRSHVGLQRAREVIPRDLHARTDDVYDANFRTLQLDRVGASTLLHGDGHAGQRYVTADGRSGLSDWQVIHRGHWAWDLAYTMNTALSVEDRRAWDRELLAHYLERLAAAGGDAPDFETAWTDYRRHAFYPYIAWIFTIGRAAYHLNWQPDEYSRAIIERTSQAIVDHDAFDALARASY